LARRRRLRMSDLRDADLVLVQRSVGPDIYDRVIGACRAARFSPRIVAEVGTSLSVLGLVAAGAGVGLVIRPLGAVARLGIAYRPLQGSGLDLPFALAHRSGDPSALLSRVRRAVHGAWPDAARAGPSPRSARS
jgi:DNA-binding transcriptional LysR family regulator